MTISQRFLWSHAECLTYKQRLGALEAPAPHVERWKSHPRPNCAASSIDRSTSDASTRSIRRGRPRRHVGSDKRQRRGASARPRGADHAPRLSRAMTRPCPAERRRCASGARCIGAFTPCRRRSRSPMSPTASASCGDLRARPFRLRHADDARSRPPSVACRRRRGPRRIGVVPCRAATTPSRWWSTWRGPTAQARASSPSCPSSRRGNAAGIVPALPWPSVPVSAIRRRPALIVVVAARVR